MWQWAVISIASVVLGWNQLALAAGVTISTSQLSELIQQAIDRGDAKLVLPQGRYMLSDTLNIKNARNLTIDGQGSRIVMTKHKSAFWIDQCSDLVLRNFTIDYDPLPFTQGTITAVAPDGLWAEFEVHEGYPRLTQEYATRYMHLYSASDRRWKHGASDYYPHEIKILSPQKGRAVFTQRQKGIAPGDLLALDIRKTAAVMIRRCPGKISFDQMTVQSAPGISFLGRFNSEQHIFTGVTIKPGPRPAGATEDRLMSSSADGVNYAMSRKGPILDGCDFSFMGDDSFNVHGAALPAIRIESETSILVARPQKPEEFSSVVRVGDTVRLLAEGNFSILGRTRVASMTMLPPQEDLRDEVVEKFPRQMRDATSFSIYRLTFESPMIVQNGQWVDMPDLNSPNYIVRNSYFHDHRGRGLRIMASDGLIEKNLFERITGAAISIGPEFAFWREAGWAENLMVRGNTMKDIGTGEGIWSPGSYAPAAIAIAAATESKQVNIASGHCDITIENNTIDGCSVSGIHAFGVSGLFVRGNRIENTNQQSSAKTGKNYGLSVEHPVEVKHASNVVLDTSR